jgi:enterochelin esterase-like enzyme
MTTRKGTIKEFDFQSNALNESIKITIYLPEFYSPLYTYPVLFALDGDDYFRLGKLVKTTEELMETSEIDDLIIVGIPYKSIQDRRDKYHPNGVKHEAYKLFLLELTRYINREYSTHQLASGHVLMGDSLAGTASLITAMEYPNTFGKVILQSPLVDDVVIQKAVNFSKQSPLSIYHVIGTEETAVKLTNGKIQDFLTPNRELKQVLQDKKVDYFYEEFSGGHFWKYWQPDIRRALIFTFQ